MVNSGFQTQVQYGPAPGVEGDFASTNPRAVVLAGPGGLIAGPQGLTVGRFAWCSFAFIDGDGAPAAANNFGSGAVFGFVHREQQALITAYLGYYAQVIPAGMPVTLFDAGDFWVRNAGAAQANPGMKAYASYADGSITFAATGAPATASGSASSIAASTFSVTGIVSGDTLTVSVVGSGTVVPGATISGTGVASGTQIVSQISGTTGGIGVYTLSIANQTATASETISGTYGTLTVGGTVAGVWGVGATISGTNVVAGTAITALGTGTGAGGTYIVNNNTVVASTAITAGLNIETKWYARSTGAPGELVKMSSNPQG